MSRRGDKREEAGYHDSRRYLKRHPPRLSDPLFRLAPREEWIEPVRAAVRLYPRLARRREGEMRAGGVGSGRRGRSAESVVVCGSVGIPAAVEAALEHFPRKRRSRLRAVLWGGLERTKADRADVGLFYRYAAVYLGFGRQKYDLKSL